MRTVSLFAISAALFCMVCYGDDQGAQKPANDKAAPLSDIAEAKVLKVYTAKDDKHKFIAYVVKWKDDEVVVSDPLAKSDFKVGDSIRFMVHKWQSQGSNPDIFTLGFVLFNPPMPKLLPWQNPQPAMPPPQT
jgi:hypothetical protein